MIVNGSRCEMAQTDSPAGEDTLHRERVPFPDPTPEMLATPEFEAVWQCIKHWDINVPGAYIGYCGATGNHVRAILDALHGVEKHSPTT